MPRAPAQAPAFVTARRCKVSALSSSGIWSVCCSVCCSQSQICLPLAQSEYVAVLALPGLALCSR